MVKLQEYCLDPITDTKFYTDVISPQIAKLCILPLIHELVSIVLSNQNFTGKSINETYT